MDALRAEGYPDDPEIVDNPWRVGLFLGGPQLRANQTRTLFPRTAPGVHYVSFGVPASSTSFTNHYPFSSGIRDWRREDLTRPVADAGGRARDGWQGEDDGSPRPWTGEDPGREYPAGAQVVHREGPREGAGYAYRGTIVGEASNPGLVGPAAVCRMAGPGACDCRDWLGVEELRTSLVDAGETSLAGPVGRSESSRRRRPAVRGAVDSSSFYGEWASPLGGPPPLRLARWAGPGVGARAPPTAPRERDRASAPATAIGVSSFEEFVFAFSFPEAAEASMI